MADPEKIRIMARLAMLEKHCGRQIRDAEDSFRIDRITNPVWLNALRMTALYLIGLTIWAVSHIDFLLGSFAGDALVPLIRRSGMFYLLLLAVTVGISLPISMMRCRKERGRPMTSMPVVVCCQLRTAKKSIWHRVSKMVSR